MTSRRKQSPAIRLREAALCFARAIREPARSYDDREFKRVDRQLQVAAKRFAEAASC